MNNKSIVTLLDNKNNIVGDFELPNDVMILKLCKRLILTLKEMELKEFISVNRLSLEFNGAKLDADETLKEYGIWDGSYIKLIY